MDPKIPQVGYLMMDPQMCNSSQVLSQVCKAFYHLRRPRGGELWVPVAVVITSG